MALTAEATGPIAKVLFDVNPDEHGVALGVVISVIILIWSEHEEAPGVTRRLLDKTARRSI